MINHWRYVRYTDDGCSHYQCLMCYANWEGRSAPGYHHEGKYHCLWRFCPYCGTEWNGPLREATYDNERMLGRHRLNREMAIREYHMPHAERERATNYYDRGVSHWWSLQIQTWVDFEDKTPGPPVIEYQGIVRGNQDGKWETRLAWKGGMMPTRKAWFFVKEELERQRVEYANRDFYQQGVFVRLLVTKQRPSHGYICENYNMENVT